MVKNVNFTKDEYKTAIVFWTLVRDVINNNVYQKKYVPALSGQSEGEYNAYVSRPAFFNATDRTRSALLGLIFAKSPEINQTGLDEILADFDLQGSNSEEFVKEITNECLITGRAGVLVDLPVRSEEIKNKADERTQNIRPYGVLYRAENIINWRFDGVNNKQKLSLVVLKENYKDYDGFAEIDKIRYRVLKLVDNIYQQEIYNEAGELQGEPIKPVANGKTLDHIPFVFFNPIAPNANIAKAPLLDMAEVNISHFKTQVDLEHGTHFVALPTPYFFSRNIDAEKSIFIGSSKFIVDSDPDAKIGFLEFSGAGIEALQKLTLEKEKRMAILGAKLLLDEKKTAEATATVAMRSSGERATLTTLAQSVSAGFKQVLQIMASFLNVSEDIEYKLNEEYNLLEIDAQILSQVMSGIQLGLMPNSVLFLLLKKGGLLPENIATLQDFEEVLSDSNMPKIKEA